MLTYLCCMLTKCILYVVQVAEVCHHLKQSYGCRVMYSLYLYQCVFKEIGHGLLEHLYEGYNCTLFAYGQTNSGKSYSLMERGVDKGTYYFVNLTCTCMHK